MKAEVDPLENLMVFLQNLSRARDFGAGRVGRGVGIHSFNSTESLHHITMESETVDPLENLITLKLEIYQ